MKKEEIYYNYIEDVYPNFENENTIEFPIDDGSEKLNTALYNLFFAVLDNDPKIQWKNPELKRQDFGKGPFYSFFLNDGDFILSTDYIGPSVWQCKDIAGYTNAEIKEILKQSRTLGGHLMWPRGKDKNGNRRTPFVNIVRGGEVSKGCGFYDRIDWTLFLLKIFYRCENEGQYNEEQYNKYNEKIKDSFQEEISKNDKECFKALYDAFYRSRDWFDVFESFNGFCDFFKLTGSFVDDDYNIIWFTDSFPIKPKKDKYKEYTENNLKAIDKRNHVLENWICYHQ